jgi:hypothetical protein
MTERTQLPNRRGSMNFSFELGTFSYVATVSYFPDGRPAEIFLSNGKAGSGSDTNARDSAVVASLALQYGVPLDVIRRALMRDAQGRPSGPLAEALDLIAGRGGL